MYVDLHLHCQGRVQCTGNRRLHVLKSDKCAVAMTYWAEPQLWLLGRQVLLFREQRWIVLLIKEKNRMVLGLVGSAGSHEWGDLSSRLALARVCWVPAPPREGVDQSPVLVTVWECKLVGFVGIYLGIVVTSNAGKVLQMQNQEISVQKQRKGF